MSQYLLLTSIIVFLCILLNKLSGKLGLPMLLAFMGLGMIFGSDGIVKIHFSDYRIAETICTIALIFIMFFGGLGVNFKKAKSIFFQASIFSTFGVLFTAVLTSLFSYFVLGFNFIISLMIGSVISSTDAASVFSILKSKKLNLKYDSASLLEVESGSNDPMAYMLTMLAIEAIRVDIGLMNSIFLLAKQIVIGLGVGYLIALAAKTVLGRISLSEGGFNSIFMMAVAIFSYAVPSFIGGNGYLSAYVSGIVIGNTRFEDKKRVISLLESISNLMQIVIFFLLGLFSEPSRLPSSLGFAIVIFIFITFVARPLVVYCIGKIFKYDRKHIMLIGFAGIRGASAIVFAIIAAGELGQRGDFIFDIILSVVLLSILFQGGLLSFVASKLDMIDDNEDVMKTFSDYEEEIPVSFIKTTIPQGHQWIGKNFGDILLPPETLAVLLEREGKRIVPDGKTMVEENDLIVLAAVTPTFIDGVDLSELVVKEGDDLIGKRVKEAHFSESLLLIIIKRGEEVIIPNGNDLICVNDIMVFNRK